MIYLFQGLEETLVCRNLPNTTIRHINDVAALLDPGYHLSMVHYVYFMLQLQCHYHEYYIVILQLLNT
jgi:hypothetical protein